MTRATQRGALIPCVDGFKRHRFEGGPVCSRCGARVPKGRVPTPTELAEQRGREHARKGRTITSMPYTNVVAAEAFERAYWEERRRLHERGIQPNART